MHMSTLALAVHTSFRSPATLAVTSSGTEPRPARRALGVALLAAFAGLLAVAPAAAQPGAGGIGIRAGVSADPAQFVIGMHYETAPLFDRLRFRPGIEVGFGDDLTLIQINPEFTYWLPVKSRDWGVYVGGGPAINIYEFNDNDHGNGDGGDVEPGINFMVGLAHRKGFFAEMKVGAIDSPDFKFAVGYTFR
jgi:hypothetical protein